MDRMDLEEDEEEEDDSGRMDSDVPSTSASVSGSPSPERQLPPHRNHHHHRHHLPRHPHPHPHTHNRGRRAVGIISDEPADGPQTLQVGGLDPGDAHIIINEGVGGVDVGVGPVRVGGVGVGVGVEDGIVSLEPNDDFAMGAPPGAPGAIGALTPRGLNLEGVGRRRNATVSGVVNITATGTTPGVTPGHGDAPDVTPRAAAIGLPMMAGNNGTIRGGQQQQQHTATNPGHQRHATIRAQPAPLVSPITGAVTGPVIPAAPTAATTTRTSNASVSHTPPHHASNNASDSSGPYRDEDVLLSLQLLAYLSKYPHVRQAFYKPRVTFHPASVELGGQRFGSGEKGRKERERKGDKGIEREEKEREKGLEKEKGASMTKETSASFFKAFTSAASSLSTAHSNTGAATSSSRGKERAQPNSSTQTDASSSTSASTIPSSSSASSKPNPIPTPSTPISTPRQTNVFSLVERFTFKPSSTETDLPNPPPRLPPEIQYWAGVIMRNACRKDDSRGGIRQCANSELSFFSKFFSLSKLMGFISDLWEMGIVSSRIREM